MADEADVLLQMWLNRWEQIRHSELQRATITNTILVLVAVGLGFMVQKGLKLGLVPVSLGILVLGLLGMLLSAKYYERFRFHLSEAAEIRSQLDARFPGAQIEASRLLVENEQAKLFPILIKVPLYRLWIALHGGIAVTGLILTLIIVI